MRVIWSSRARADLSAIVAYIANDNLTAGLEMADRIYGLAARLAEHPRLGRRGRRPGLRELVVSRSPYIVIYRIGELGVDVVRVLHGAQNWPTEST